MKRALLLATTTGYQTRMFADAAARLGVELLYATDRCDQIDDPWRDGAIAVRYHRVHESLAAVQMATASTPIDGVLAVGDRPAVLAAHVMHALQLPGHPVEAAAAARDKVETRQRFQAAGLLVPWFTSVAADASPAIVATGLIFPVVVKPTMLSGSRGVMRADDSAQFVTAFERLRRLLTSADVQELRDPASGVIQIEEYIDGAEFAVEGLLEHGVFRCLAIFDKPDPLVGPFFEETIYLTPSRADVATQAAIERTIAAACLALGLHHGPIHAECRVNARGVYVLEVAARPIGGLCARALRFVAASGATTGLEDLLLRHALGESSKGWQRERDASGVMMVPIPRAGIYRGVSGEDEARAVPFVVDVRITAKPDQRLMPLPEGASYLGFIFARAKTPEAVEQALRRAHTHLRFTIASLIPIA